MVSGLGAALTLGAAVSQCAEITRIALGRGKVLPSSSRALPVAPGSIASVGAPCETKRAGIIFPLFDSGKFHRQRSVAAAAFLYVGENDQRGSKKHSGQQHRQAMVASRNPRHRAV